MVREEDSEAAGLAAAAVWAVAAAAWKVKVEKAWGAEEMVQEEAAPVKMAAAAGPEEVAMEKPEVDQEGEATAAPAAVPEEEATEGAAAAREGAATATAAAGSATASAAGWENPATEAVQVLSAG
jgi:hypothetical protein